MTEYAMRHKQTLEGTLLLKLDGGDVVTVGRVSIPVEFDVTARIPEQETPESAHGLFESMGLPPLPEFPTTKKATP